MNVLENNRLILEFMELEFEETMNGDKVVCIHDVEERECFFEEKDLRFHKSWDWLTPVLKKIVSVGRNFCKDEETLLEFNNHTLNHLDPLTCSLEYVYNYAVKVLDKLQKIKAW